MVDVTPEIVGIMLVHNEDVFAAQALRNVLDFCDRIIVLDHGSSDHTYARIEALAAQWPKIELTRISDARQSHLPLELLAGGRFWVFGVDGDELYDPAGLQRLRAKLFAGEFDESWVLFGNVLNCVSVDQERMRARGYLAPPCRSMTKLYNFQMLNSWTDCPQRLHGGTASFARGNLQCRNDMYKHLAWEDAEFRCLHACFMRRSSLEPEAASGGVARQNVTEEQHMGLKRNVLRWWLARSGKQLQSRWKREKYQRGPLVEKDATPFFELQIEPSMGDHVTAKGR